MRRFIALLGLVTSILVLPNCCGKPPKAALSSQASEVDALVHKTVALVHFVDDDGNEVPPSTDAQMHTYCGGVWVSDDKILTAFHCVEDLHGPDWKPPPPSPIPEGLEALFGPLFGAPPPPENDPTGAEVLYADREDIQSEGTDPHFDYHTGKVQRFDRDHDLALIEVAPSHPQHLTASIAHEAHPGDPLHMIGHQGQLYWTYIHGYVAALRTGHKSPTGKPVDIIQVSAPVWFGSSGGPAFNERGEVVGICSQLRKNVPDVGFIVPFTAINKFLQ